MRARLWIGATLLALAGCLSARAALSPDEHGREEPLQTDLKIGLALGGGGANGLAHIAILEAFDELGLRPHRIAGTSIGAIMGALYASSNSGRDIKQIVANVVAQETDTWRERLLDRQLLRWIRFVDLEFGEGGLLGTDAFISYLQESVKVDTFEELDIPLYIVATDLWSREEVIITSGDIYPAVKASMAVPGLFSPVKWQGRVLVDGGAVNPVPYDILFDDCDFVVAINVIGKSVPEDDLSFLKAMYTSVRVMQTSILREKLKQRKPDLYIETRIEGVRMLEFHRLNEIYEKALPAKQLLKKELRERLVNER